MKITSKGDTVYLADEKTGKSAVLRLDDPVWRLSVGRANHVYDDLETAISFAEKILADEREDENETGK